MKGFLSGLIRGLSLLDPTHSVCVLQFSDNEAQVVLSIVDRSLGLRKSDLLTCS